MNGIVYLRGEAILYYRISPLYMLVFMFVLFLPSSCFHWCTQVSCTLTLPGHVRKCTHCLGSTCVEKKKNPYSYSSQTPFFILRAQKRKKKKKERKYKICKRLLSTYFDCTLRYFVNIFSPPFYSSLSLPTTLRNDGDLRTKESVAQRGVES